MRRKRYDREPHRENAAPGEKLEIADSSIPSIDLATQEAGTSEKSGQDVSFTIVDDPKNQSVYKGPGNYAAIRAESAIRTVEQAFPPLRFATRCEKNLTALHVEARVPASVDNARLLATLSSALASTGTRLAPIIGELRTDAPAMPERRA